MVSKRPQHDENQDSTFKDVRLEQNQAYELSRKVTNLWKK